MLGPNGQVWDLSPILEIFYGVGFLKPWVLQLQQLTFVVCFFQGSYQLVSGIDIVECNGMLC